MSDFVEDCYLKGTCQNMCPLSERLQRMKDNQIHRVESFLASKLENKENPNKQDSIMKKYMIKRYQRSSADHSLQITDSIRTPETLLKTIKFIQLNIVPIIEEYKEDEFNNKEKISRITFYLYIWDRYRMIAKDFTLQSLSIHNSSTSLSIAIECHELMIRWHIYMTYILRFEDEFIEHSQQNDEQLINLLKTLHMYYTLKPKSENYIEFLSYLLLLNLQNGVEFNLLLKNIQDTTVLENNKIVLLSKLWTTYINMKYVKFFHYYKQLDFLDVILINTSLDSFIYLNLKKFFHVYYVKSPNPILYNVLDFINAFYIHDIQNGLKCLKKFNIKLKTFNNNTNTYEDFLLYPNSNVNPSLEYYILIDTKNLDDNLSKNNKGEVLIPSLKYYNINLIKKN